MKNFSFLLNGLLLCGLAEIHAAQPVERAQNFQSNQSSGFIKPVAQTSLADSEVIPSSPGDADLGEQWLLKYKEKSRPFTLTGDIAGYSTNNAGLVETGTQSDQYFVGLVAAIYQPKFNDQLIGEFLIRQATFRYKRFSDLDFDAQTIGVGLTYLPPVLWDIAFYARYNYYRILDVQEHDEIFTNHSVTLGIQKSFALSRVHYLYGGYSSMFSLGDSSISTRNEHGAYAGYHVELTRSLQADLFYRVSLFDYANGGRSDINQVATVAAQYRLTKWLFAYASFTWTVNDSNGNRLDYSSLSPGIGLSATFKF